MELVGIVIGILIGAIFSGIVIWIVGKLGLGLQVSGFGAAYIAAIVIAVVSGILIVVLGALGITIGGGILGAIVHLLVAAGVLVFAGNLVKGLTVKGYTGAMVAAIAIAAVGWVAGLVAGLFV